jgi:hypothetical protein
MTTKILFDRLRAVRDASADTHMPAAVLQDGGFRPPSHPPTPKALITMSGKYLYDA